MDLKYRMPSAPDILTQSIPEVVSPVARRSVLRVVFSFPVMLASLLVLLMVLTVRERFNDPDVRLTGPDRFFTLYWLHSGNRNLGLLCAPYLAVLKDGPNV